jgi:epsilon-lactone hydrolase
LHFLLCGLALSLCSVTVASPPQNTDQSPAPSVIAPDGTVRVTRVVPVPTTISPEAQQELRTTKPSPDLHQTLQEHRAYIQKWQADLGERALKIYPAKLATDAIAGVPVQVVTPPVIAREKASRVLINLHGGGLRVDSGSLSER